MVAGAPLQFESFALAAALAVGPDACLSHNAAGRLWKMDEVVSAAPEVSLIGRSRRHVEGVVIHEPRTLTGRDVTTLGVIPVTTPARTLIDLAGIVNLTALEDALDSAVRRELVTVKALMRRLRYVDARGRTGLPLLKQLLDERLGTPGSGSTLENIVRRAFDDAGLPSPVAQYEIHGPDGFVARVDFAYPDARLAIEVDGYEFHSSRRAWEGDLVRQNKIVALGWFVLRTTRRQVRERPHEVVAQVWRRLTTLEVVNLRQDRRRQ